MPKPTDNKERLGIQSIEVGMRLLYALAHKGAPMMLRDLARDAGMPAAKAHRYLVSFQRTRLVEQEESSGKYGLGEFALNLGLVALGRLDPIKLAGPILEKLCEEIKETVALAVWGTHGATIVRLVEPGGPVTVTLRPGTVLPLINSATGRAFAAFGMNTHLRQLLDKEIQTLAKQSGQTITHLRQQIEGDLELIRVHGVAQASGSLTPGINGFSAPVYDHSGKMGAALTTLGPAGMLDSNWDSETVTAVVVAAKELSKRLGYSE